MIASVPELLVTSSVLILALLVLRLLLRGRISRRLQYSLWDWLYFGCCSLSPCLRAAA